MRFIVSDNINYATLNDFQKKKIDSLRQIVEGASIDALLAKHGQKEKFNGTDITIDDDATATLCSYRLNNKARLYYVIYKNKNGEPLFFALAVDWGHKHDRFSLLQNPETRHKLIPWIKAELANSEISKAAPTDLAPPSPKKKVITLRPKQYDLVTNNGFAKVVLASAGTGKTVGMLAWTENLIREMNDCTVRYFAPKLDQCRDVEKQLSLDKAERKKLVLQNEKSIVRFFLKKLFPAIGALFKGQFPADKVFFKAWYEEQLTSNRKANKSGFLQTCNVDFLFAEITQVIIQPDYSNIQKPFLSRLDYCALGADRSYFAKDQRDQLYTIFETYLNRIECSRSEDKKYFEPRLLLHIVYLHLLNNPIPASAMTDALAIDEGQAVHPWLMHCLLVLTQQKEAGLVRVVGDPSQTGDEPRRHVLAPSTQALTHYSVPVEQIMLDENMRNSRLVGLLCNHILHTKAKHCGTRERRATIGLNSSGAKLLGELSSGMPKEADYIEIVKQDANCVIVIPDDADIKSAREKWGNNVFTASRVGGLEWNHVILYIPTESKMFKCGLMSALSPNELPDITPETADAPPQASRQNNVDADAEIAFSQFYLIASRAKESFRFIDEAGKTPEFIDAMTTNTTVFALSERKSYGEVASEITKSTKAEWLALAKSYLDKQKKDEAENILWSDNLWDSPENARNAKSVLTQWVRRAIVTEKNIFTWAELLLNHADTTAWLNEIKRYNTLSNEVITVEMIARIGTTAVRDSTVQIQQPLEPLVVAQLPSAQSPKNKSPAFFGAETARTGYQSISMEIHKITNDVKKRYLTLEESPELLNVIAKLETLLRDFYAAILAEMNTSPAYPFAEIAIAGLCLRTAVIDRNRSDLAKKAIAILKQYVNTEINSFIEKTDIPKFQPLICLLLAKGYYILSQCHQMKREDILKELIHSYEFFTGFNERYSTSHTHDIDEYTKSKITMRDVLEKLTKFSHQIPKKENDKIKTELKRIKDNEEPFISILLAMLKTPQVYIPMLLMWLYQYHGACHNAPTTVQNDWVCSPFKMLGVI